MAMKSPALILNTPRKLGLFSYLLFMPLTPHQFRSALNKEPDFAYAALMFDNLMRIYLQKKYSPIVSEGLAMTNTKKWWMEGIDQKTQEKVRKLYYEGNRKFLINLAWNNPYGDNHPFQILKNGLPIWDLPTILGKVIDPEATKIVIDKIEALGGSGKIYEVRFVKQNPQGTQWGVSVKEWTPPAKKHPSEDH